MVLNRVGTTMVNVDIDILFIFWINTLNTGV